MKNLIAVLLTALILLCGCAPKKSIAKPVHFYYPVAQYSYGQEEHVIHPQTTDGSIYDDLSAALTAYLAGPADSNLRNPFPTDTALIRAETADNTVTVILSDSFSQLQGSKLSLACACVAATAMDLTGAASARIRCETASLGGNESVTLRMQDISFYDAVLTEVIAPTETEATP